MKGDELVFVQGEYWVVIYFNNMKIFEDHSMHPLEFVTIVKKYNIDVNTTSFTSLHLIEEEYPEKFTDLKLKQNDLVKYNSNNSSNRKISNQISLFD